jgi:hypothetical protein
VREPTQKHKHKQTRVTCSTAIDSSSRSLLSAPTSAHVTSGTVAKPSLFADGCTCFTAPSKSLSQMLSGASCARDSGAAARSRSDTRVRASSDSDAAEATAVTAEEEEEGGEEEGEEEEEAVDATVSAVDDALPPSMAAGAPSPAAAALPLPANSSRKMRLTAITAASFVSATRSAPT